MGKEKEKLGNPDFWGRFADTVIETRAIDKDH